MNAGADVMLITCLQLRKAAAGLVRTNCQGYKTSRIGLSSVPDFAVPDFVNFIA